jgi:hypothetical protein
LLLTTTMPARSDDQGIKPRTFGPLLSSIGSVLLGGHAGHLAEEEFGPLVQYYGPSYSPYPLVNRPHYGHNGPYGHIGQYGLYGYGHPALVSPVF